MWTFYDERMTQVAKYCQLHTVLTAGNLHGTSLSVHRIQLEVHWAGQGQRHPEQHKILNYSIPLRISVKIQFYGHANVSVVDPHWFQCGSRSGSSFYLNAGLGLGSQTNNDPCRSGYLSDFKVTKSWILYEKYVDIGSKNNKNLFEREEIWFICNLLVNFHAPGSGSAYPIRFRNRDSQMNVLVDPCGSGSTTLAKVSLWWRPRIVGWVFTSRKIPT